MRRWLPAEIGHGLVRRWGGALLGAALVGSLVLPGCAADSTRQTRRGVLTRRDFGERTARATRTIADLGELAAEDVSFRSARIGRRLGRAGENTAEDAAETWDWLGNRAPAGLSDRSRRFARAVSMHWNDFWAKAGRDAELFFARAWEDLKILE